MSITYKPPLQIRRPFVRGEIVEVVDRNLLMMERERVVYAGPRVVRLAGGRRFRASDGWWIGESGTWPFPSIRHARKGGAA